MSKQRGLGRGLGAFFPSAAPPAPESRADGTQVASIPIDAIAPNPNQPRRQFDAEGLAALSQSIASNGVISPILVRAAGDQRFEIVAGERRWRAARLAGLTHMPALVREADDPHALELAMLENLQRTDLNPMEEAAGYKMLLDEYGFTQDALCTRLGKARPTMSNALRLLTLPDAVQALVRDGRLSAGHARALASLPPQRAEELAREAAQRGLSVRDVERLAAAAPTATKRPRGGAGKNDRAGDAQPLAPELAEVETRLRFALATRVAIKPAAQGGTIEIRYAGDDELLRIVDALCPEDRG